MSCVGDGWLWVTVVTVVCSNEICCAELCWERLVVGYCGNCCVKQ
jgi:hypothetical protein